MQPKWEIGAKLHKILFLLNRTGQVQNCGASWGTVVALGPYKASQTIRNVTPNMPRGTFQWKCQNWLLHIKLLLVVKTKAAAAAAPTLTVSAAWWHAIACRGLLGQLHFQVQHQKRDFSKFFFSSAETKVGKQSSVMILIHVDRSLRERKEVKQQQQHQPCFSHLLPAHLHTDHPNHPTQAYPQILINCCWFVRF